MLARRAYREFGRGLRLDLWTAHDLLRVEGIAAAQGELTDTRSALAATLADITGSAT